MNQYRLHIVALPHVNTDGKTPTCAYTGKVERACAMFASMNHAVYLYSGRENTAPCTEHIRCTKATGSLPAFDANGPEFAAMNAKVIQQMRKRIQPRDMILLIGGDCQKPIADAFPENFAVEYGIGYAGTFARFQVFESYAWMHAVYGSQQGAYAANGNYWHTVIPNYYRVSDFPEPCEKPSDYFLYIGRLTARKGIAVAERTCEAIGARLIIAGAGEYVPTYGEVIGTVGVKERGELMRNARAVFVPTTYLGPFEGVHAEANLCGTPVITTPWGVFSESVLDGFNGFKCNTLSEFVQATNEVAGLSRNLIRLDAISRFDMERVKYQYQAYFDRINTLWGDGWNSLWDDQLTKSFQPPS